MKFSLIILFTLSSFISSAMKRPEEIPSKLKEVKVSSWYLEKYRSWTSYLEDNSTDKDGWVQCFKAARYADVSKTQIDELVQKIETLFPGSSELYWVKAKYEGWNDAGVANLEKALINSSKDEWLVEKIMLAEVTSKDKRDLLSKLHRQNLIYPSLLNYCYNVLMSVGDNGYLLTEGENTTVPIWILQEVMNVRTDVKVLNRDLLLNTSYLETVLTSNDLHLSNGDIGRLPLENQDKQFFFALTLPKERIKELQDQLYVVGLASLLSKEPFDNYQTVQKNIEDKFLLDYLTVDFNGEPKNATGRTFETNYIVPFFILKQYYDESGNTEQSAYWETQIKQIAERSQIAARVNMLLSKNSSPRNFKPTDIKVKKLEKRLTKVKDNIYAGSYEVTNEEYEFFLTYLLDEGYKDLYQQANFDFSKYDVVNQVFGKAYHYTFNKGTREDFSNYPSMDMTYEAAQLYCEWLTAQYNIQDGRKFKKVKFRLPSKQEWIMAALGYVDFQSWVFEDNIVKARPDGDKKPRYFEEFRIGDYEHVDYPWYHSDWYKSRSAITNQFGCYLANVKVPDTVSCKAGISGDGFTITSPVGTYFSNDMGLYDVIGNVAEMIDQPGKAMGGSWGHIPEESTITSINQYDTSDPKVGFRVFMEVIEE
ncbi:formylglycine-generating enzyme family protein [Marinoscillum sp.]|uniref:formylglycine-generating enzyme family protein n=1 Tax=Marinoscillum sp. TaxID=2024838 RepID=UPI003BAC6B8A